jgi:hypothetical protein
VRLYSPSYLTCYTYRKTFANLRDGSLCLQKSLLRYAFHHIKDIFSTSNYLNVSAIHLDSSKADTISLPFVQNTLSQQIIAENYLGRSQPPILDVRFENIYRVKDYTDASLLHSFHSTRYTLKRTSECLSDRPDEVSY